ncbi:hypothetical protein RHSIM_Rhsim13G0008200 [Rhododendron simsii]|uniref:Histidine kinase domain-containing protein n=1 Tax=Rhododendron simsii TaxID=118357 RepID=A0A834L6F0_RHOSS|nr:hypothetical protein RHSIM_Rhsim13G0008200 [Rhododendron simsii]
MKADCNNTLLCIYAMGDEKRVIQTIINIMGNALKFTKKGYVSVVASIAKPETGLCLSCGFDCKTRDWQSPEFYPVSSDGYFFVRVQVDATIYSANSSILLGDCKADLWTCLMWLNDSGCGILPQDIALCFTKFAQSQSGSNRNNNGAGLGLAICKRFITLMGGHIWIESEGLDKGATVSFIAKLGICNDPNESTMPEDAVADRTDQGSADVIARNLFAEELPRYQRSL